MTMEAWNKGNYFISTDKAKLDRETIYRYLAEESYWAEQLPRSVFEKSIEGSAVCYGVYFKDPKSGLMKQVGFARVISDLATFAYLADVFILKPHRGKGLSKWLVDVILHDSRLSGLRRFLLATKDAHGLYSQHGFKPLANPESMMEIARGASIYKER
ncbi:MAG TPA: GNAT family N-acetyltransferase [Bacillales bacterium]|nr:GNAT family N-acetyltransferase [Bacillales bacterium]